MLTTFLALIVAFFVSKTFGTIVVQFVAKLLGWGVTAASQVGSEIGGQVGASLGENVATPIRSVFSKPQTTAAMAAFVVNTEEFGKVVFGSEAKLIDAVSHKTIEAIADKLSTESGKAEVSKRLASMSKKKRKQ